MEKTEFIDETCEKIFLYLALTKNIMGFNDLHRGLIKTGLKMSTPTLAEHLKHLTKKKVLIRKKVGKQRVSYEINWKSFQHLHDARKIGKRMEKHFFNQGNYRDLSPKDELVVTESTIIYVMLQQLRLSILGILNPEKAFEYNLELLFILRYFDIYKSILIHGCKENKEEFGKQILQLIEARLKEYYNKIPDPQ